MSARFRHKGFGYVRDPGLFRRISHESVSVFQESSNWRPCRPLAGDRDEQATWAGSFLLHKSFFEKRRIGFSQIRLRTFDFTESDARKKPFLNALTRPAL
jgi:hypothetical protein